MVMSTNNGYAPPQSPLADVSDSTVDTQLASPGSRLGAACIDGLIFCIPYAPSYVLAIPQLIGHAGGVAGIPKIAPFALWSAMVASRGWFYFGVLAAICTLTLTAVLVKRNGQTIGKKLVGIKVVRSDASRASVARIFWLRNVANLLLTWLPFIGSLYTWVDLLFIFGKARRCLHDHIADTIVVRA